MHAKPILLFWSFGYTKEKWQLCYDIADDGAVIFDGLMQICAKHQSDYSTEEIQLEFGTEKKRFNSPLQDIPSGRRLQHVHEIPENFTVRVEDPWNTKYDDVSAQFDFVNINERYGESRLFLPNGQPHHGPVHDWLDEGVNVELVVESSGLTVAEACALPPPRIVQVIASLAADSLVELTCFGLDGGQLGSITVADTGTTLFHSVQASLANVVGTKAGLLKFITKDGVQLGTEHKDGTIAELFLSADERVISL